jgi:hypothetical protein
MTKLSNVRQTVAALLMTAMMTSLFVAGAVAPAVHQHNAFPVTQAAA